MIRNRSEDIAHCNHPDCQTGQARVLAEALAVELHQYDSKKQ